jgi:hypothetical protein
MMKIMMMTKKKMMKMIIVMEMLKMKKKGKREISSSIKIVKRLGISRLINYS